MKTTSAIAFSLLSFCAVAASADAQVRAAEPAAPQQVQAARELPWRAPRTLLVSWRPGASAAGKASARALVRAESFRDLTTPAMRTFGAGDFESLELPSGCDLDASAALLRGAAAVRAVDFDAVVRTCEVSNDPGYTGGQTWGLYGDRTAPAQAYGSQAGELWARGMVGSSNVYVGIIDEGIDINHPDLAPNIWQNPFDPQDGIDNDGNGKIDDRNGWDFHFNDRTVYDGSATDLVAESHGTHVAGIIGARGGNGVGVAGVCWQVKMISAKVMDRGNGSIANLVLAIDYMVDLKTRHGIDIAALNMSLSHPGFVQAEYDAINRARMANIVVVAAAGNGGSDYIGDNIDLAPIYPAAYGNGNLITVANIDNLGGLAPSSNFGPTKVHIGAPGTAIRSTLPQNRYGLMTGTSMAAPFVTGAAVLWHLRNPTHNAGTVRGGILITRLPTPSLSGKVATSGRLDMSNY